MSDPRHRYGSFDLSAMNRKYDSQQKQEAVRLYCEGKTVREVHRLTGISEPYVKEILHQGTSSNTVRE